MASSGCNTMNWETVAKGLLVHDQKAISVFCEGNLNTDCWWLKNVALDYLKYGDGLSAAWICGHCVKVLLAADGIDSLLPFLNNSVSNSKLFFNLAIGMAEERSTAKIILRALSELGFQPHAECVIIRRLYTHAKEASVDFNAEDFSIMNNRVHKLMKCNVNEWPNIDVERKSNRFLLFVKSEIGELMSRTKKE